MKTLRLSAIILSLFALTTSCKKEFDIDPHGSGFHYVGPLAKSELAIDNLNSVQSFSFGRDFSVAEIGIQTGSFPLLLPFANLKVGPHNFLLTSKVQSVSVDTANIQLYIKNNFPVNLKQGLVLAVQNPSDNSFIYQFTLMNDLQPGQSTTRIDKIINQKIENAVNVTVLNIASDGVASPITIDSTNSINVQVKLDVLGLNEIVLKPSNTLNIEDTTDFHPNFNNPFNQKDGGILKLFRPAKLLMLFAFSFIFRQA